MEIILTKPVRNLGKIGDVVLVKDGFARNYLIPQKMAIRSNEKNKTLILEQKSHLEVENTNKKLDAAKNALIISDKVLVFIKQASDDGKLFGSISKKDIAKALSDTTNIEIKVSSILLDNNIKSTGVFPISVELHPEITSPIIVNIAKSDTDAKQALESFKNA